MKTKSVGIVGLGSYLPSTVRTNDWWPDEVVDVWRAEGQGEDLMPEVGSLAPKTEGQRAVSDAIAAFADDPFRGYVARRVLDDDLDASHMEIEAAREAVADAGVAMDEIDLLLCHSWVPDHLSYSNAYAIHHALGLPQACMATSNEGSFNSFAHQLSLAHGMIATGQARHALLVQSCLGRRLLEPTWPASAWYGDAATAVVVGPVGEDRGILAAQHRMDGSVHDCLVAGVPGGRRWYDDGPIRWFPRSADGRNLIFLVADLARAIAEDTLREAGLRHDAIDFYASHQATTWFLRLTKDFIGLPRAESAGTATWSGNVGPCNVPLQLVSAHREGVLHDGQRVMLYSGGPGSTWSCLILRWGRGDAPDLARERPSEASASSG